MLRPPDLQPALPWSPWTSAIISDGPKTRTAIHPNGTVYGAFYSRNPGGSWDVVVVKDTNWGNSAQPYHALIDTGDNLAGVRVASSISSRRRELRMLTSATTGGDGSWPSR